jgi:fructokinase
VTVDANIIVAGDTLVDLVPRNPGPPGDSGGYEPTFGGSGANVAMALDRLGIPPLCWTRLATDDLGEFLRAHFEASDIPSDLIVTDGDARTTLALVTHDADRGPSYAFYRHRGPETGFQPGTIPDEAVRSASWVHTTGVTMSVEPSRSAMLELHSRASGHCPVSLDPNWRPEMWESRHEFRAVIRGALPDVDVVTATPEELEIAGFDAGGHAELARSVAEAGPHTVVLTLGEAGAFCYGTDGSPVAGRAEHGGYDIDPVDATGAGDAFLGAFIAALTHGVRDPRRALAVANAAGAVATTQAGAVTALTGPEALERFCGDVPWLS